MSPALPAGLNLSATTGTISGTPTAVASTSNYTVTASNSAGSTTATLTLTVNAAPLSANNINLIFVVSEDLALDQASGDVNPSTANLTNQGLQRSLLMAPFLQQAVLGMNECNRHLCARTDDPFANHGTITPTWWRWRPFSSLPC